MGRVGYPDKARLYKHSSTTGRTPSPERGISPQSSHTNAYKLVHTETDTDMSAYTLFTHTHTQISSDTLVATFVFSQALLSFVI